MQSVTAQMLALVAQLAAARRTASGSALSTAGEWLAPAAGPARQPGRPVPPATRRRGADAGVAALLAPAELCSAQSLWSIGLDLMVGVVERLADQGAPVVAADGVDPAAGPRRWAAALVDATVEAQLGLVLAAISALLPRPVTPLTCFGPEAQHRRA